MKSLLALLAGVLLTACVGPKYHAVGASGESGYFVADSFGAAPITRYVPAYFVSLQAYGVYPWWSYTYYSPNFYPHYFSIRHPIWPAYAVGFGAWCNGCPQGYPCQRQQPYWHPAPLSTEPYAEMPAPGSSLLPLPRAVEGTEAGLLIEHQDLYGEIGRQGSSQWRQASVHGERLLQSIHQTSRTLRAIRPNGMPGSALGIPSPRATPPSAIPAPRGVPGATVGSSHGAPVQRHP